ncbi:MAG: hypothetical protein ABI650_01515 [Dokdonella sp.]
MNADTGAFCFGRYLVLAALIGLPPSLVQAATVVIANGNAVGVGFNDTAPPAAGSGCNAGETLGQCRLRVFNQAALQWGNLLVSSVTITVNGSMIAQTCDANGAVLGSAGPTSAFANFPNAPRANVAYVQALANSYAGVDLSPGQADLNANFNVSLDSGCLTGSAGSWYGTDPPFRCRAIARHCCPWYSTRLAMVSVSSLFTAIPPVHRRRPCHRSGVPTCTTPRPTSSGRT